MQSRRSAESVGSGLYTVHMARDVVHRLLATDVALDKLGARGILAEEAEQLPRNRHLMIRNPHEGGGAGDVENATQARTPARPSSPPKDVWRTSMSMSWASRCRLR
jgi:hypothetical protein